MTTISLNNISITFESAESKTAALKDINLELKDGEFVSVIGPSGCGKSTLIDIIAGLKKPSEGTVIVGNKEVVGPGSDLGIVFQDYSLFP